MRIELLCKNGRTYNGHLHHTDTSHVFVRVDGKPGVLILHWDWVTEAYRVSKGSKRKMNLNRYRKK